MNVKRTKIGFQLYQTASPLRAGGGDQKALASHKDHCLYIKAELVNVLQTMCLGQDMQAANNMPVVLEGRETQRMPLQTHSSELRRQEV